MPDGGAQRGVVADEVARAMRQDQVTGPAGVRCDDWHPGGEVSCTSWQNVSAGRLGKTSSEE
jgi:hypothetical protein